MDGGVIARAVKRQGGRVPEHPELDGLAGALAAAVAPVTWW